MNIFGECGVVSIHIPISISGIKNIIRSYVSNVDEELKNVKKIMLKQLIENTKDIKNILEFLDPRHGRWIHKQFEHKNIEIGNVIDFAYTNYVIFVNKWKDKNNISWNLDSNIYVEHLISFISLENRFKEKEIKLKNNNVTNKCYSYH